MQKLGSKINPEKKKKSDDSLRGIWDNIKQTNIHIIGVAEWEETEKR